MKKVAGICVFLFFAQWAIATHIVGGEFEIIHLRGDRYMFRQIQYFDVVNGDPRAKDFQIRASIFRKRDNVFVRNVTMNYVKENLVDYTNPICTDDRLITNRIEYTTEATLDSALFSDPDGYYMVWERCCRNNIITNIVRPEETGQTFYIEFPAIRKNGEVFRNSSPQLFPPLSDYACVGRLYYVDFRGFDPDGDSLVYSLNTPLNSSRYEPLPLPTPAPHRDVMWNPGISGSYQIPGNPTLMINKKGFLTVTPSEEGLFVFSVKCEEFRDGIKIGEVLRDFQLLVIDCPDPGNKPEIQVKSPDSDRFVSVLDTIYLKSGDERCFDFRVKDKDGGETIRLHAKAVNFEENVQSILSTSIGYLPGSTDTLGIQVCLPECPYLQNEPYIIDIIAQDNTCPLPLMDTLRMIVVMDPPPNTPPVFKMPQQDELFASYLEGDTIDVEFLAVDADGDQIVLTIEGIDFDLAEFGIIIDTIENSPGTMKFRLLWDTDCQKYPFALKTDFQLRFYVEDLDRCMLDNRDSVVLNIRVELPANNVPEVLIGNSPTDKQITVVVGDYVLIDIQARDADPTDILTLFGIASNNNAGLLFSTVSGKGIIRSTFQWEATCDALANQKGSGYEMLFLTEDADKCKVTNADTARLTIKVVPPSNSSPEILINGDLPADTIWVNAGELLDLNLTGIDLDDDSIALKIINKDILKATGATFRDVAGNGSLSSTLSWQTDCSALGANFATQSYNFSFILEDFKCSVAAQDRADLVVAVRDLETSYNFFVPNVFTPNAEDNINETYFVPGLPRDNCARQFKEVIIFNRWGKEVFRSPERDFQWTGEGFATGVYYYILYFTGLNVKGTLSLLR